MLPDPFTDFPATACRVIDMLQGDVLFRQGQTTSGLYRVIAGSVTLLRSGQTGDTLTLHRAQAGSYFAEASIFSDSYHCDAICTQGGEVLKISNGEILTAMRRDPAFSEAFMRRLAIQVQQHRAHIELLAIRAAKDRVFAAVQAGYFEGTVTELASRISLSHEACYRALRSLCDDGRLVQTGRGQYQLSQ